MATFRGEHQLFKENNVQIKKLITNTFFSNNITKHKLPLEYRWLTANGFKGFIPWLLIEELGEAHARAEYQVESGKDFYPFAYRQDCDDIAGFKVEKGEILSEVISVHLTWSHRYEGDYLSPVEFKNMFDWLKIEVIPETSDWMSEEEIEDE